MHLSYLIRFVSKPNMSQWNNEYYCDLDRIQSCIFRCSCLCTTMPFNWWLGLFFFCYFGEKFIAWHFKRRSIQHRNPVSMWSRFSGLFFISKWVFLSTSPSLLTQFVLHFHFTCVLTFWANSMFILYFVPFFYSSQCILLSNSNIPEREIHAYVLLMPLLSFSVVRWFRLFILLFLIHTILDYIFFCSSFPSLFRLLYDSITYFILFLYHHGIMCCAAKDEWMVQYRC